MGAARTHNTIVLDKSHFYFLRVCYSGTSMQISPTFRECNFNAYSSAWLSLQNYGSYKVSLLSEWISKSEYF